jgi:hypothetical protein
MDYIENTLIWENYKISNLINSKNFKKWFNGSQVVDENGSPLVVYHGTRNKFDSFVTGSETPVGGSSGIFFTDVHDIAANYANSADEAHENDSGVHSVFLKMVKPYIIDAHGSHWNHILLDEVWVVRDENGDIINKYRYERDAEVFYDDYNDDFVEEYGIEPGEYGKITLSKELDEDGEYETTDGIFGMAVDNGYDGVIIKNVIDVGGEGAELIPIPSTIYIVKTSLQIKSVYNNGEFNPESYNIFG